MAQTVNTETNQISNKYDIERGLEIDIIDIELNPWNPNRTTETQQKAIGESLGWVGQVLEILVRPHPEKEGKYQVIDGEHRLAELDKAGKQLVFVNCLHGLSDADAKKLTIIMNETRGSADKIELAQLLADINANYTAEGLSDMMGVGLPYDPKELDELIKLAGTDWDSFGGNEEGDNDSDREFESQEEWKMLTIKMPVESFEILEDVYKLIEEEIKSSGESLPKDRAIAWGEVLGRLAEEYRGG